MPDPRMVVLGMTGRTPFAGVAWQVLHYLEGLRRLGCEVHYVEDTGERAVRPGAQRDHRRPGLHLDGDRAAARVDGAVGSVGVRGPGRRASRPGRPRPARSLRAGRRADQPDWSDRSARRAAGSAAAPVRRDRPGAAPDRDRPRAPIHPPAARCAHPPFHLRGNLGGCRLRGARRGTWIRIPPHAPARGPGLVGATHRRRAEEQLRFTTVASWRQTARTSSGRARRTTGARTASS